MDMAGMCSGVRFSFPRRHQNFIILKQAKGRGAFDRVLSPISWRECEGWTQVASEAPTSPDAA